MTEKHGKTVWQNRTGRLDSIDRTRQKRQYDRTRQKRQYDRNTQTDIMTEKNKQTVWQNKTATQYDKKTKKNYDKYDSGTEKHKHTVWQNKTDRQCDWIKQPHRQYDRTWQTNNLTDILTVYRITDACAFRDW